jgi:hypothetical protein
MEREPAIRADFLDRVASFLTLPGYVSKARLPQTTVIEQSTSIKLKDKTMKTPRMKSIVWPNWWRGFLVISVVLACLALPQVEAVCQEGCNGNGNTFLGDDAFLNRTGHSDTAIGNAALRFEIVSVSNTATGTHALYNNTGPNSASGNTANGADALYNNTTGRFNTAIGASALYTNTTGTRNTANGYQALYSNLSGRGNTAIGFQALYQNTGSNNVGLGFNAGSKLTAGGGNVCIGYNVLGVAGESNTTRISNVYYSVASARPVYINSDNKIGTLVSSRRFKEGIKPMDKASEAILAFQPVTFRYKKEIEPNGATMFGLIAEDVENVDPDLVTRNEKGEPETVRYEAVNAMLLNEFLKEHGKLAEQDRRLEKRDRIIAQRETEIHALESQLQKVSAELAAANPSRGGLESIKSAARVVTDQQTTLAKQTIISHQTTDLESSAGAGSSTSSKSVSSE